MKDKAYRGTPIGLEVGHFLRKLKWSDASENTLLSYESTLSKLAYDFANKELADVTLDELRDFLDEHWGDSSAATRRQRLATLKSFYAFCVEERGVEANPIATVKPPKKTDVVRNAYDVDVIDQLRAAQPTLRDQICVQLLGRLGLRKNELRMIRIGDFNIIKGTVSVHAKGGHVHKVPLAYPELIDEIEVYIVGLGSREYLLYGKQNRIRPLIVRGRASLVQEGARGGWASRDDQDARDAALGRGQPVARDGQHRAREAAPAAQARSARPRRICIRRWTI